jgi:hypothetical protein
MLTGFARHVDLVVLDAENFLEVLQEFQKVLRSLFLSGRFGSAGRVAGADGLVNP